MCWDVCLYTNVSCCVRELVYVPECVRVQAVAGRPRNEKYIDGWPTILWNVMTQLVYVLGCVCKLVYVPECVRVHVILGVIQWWLKPLEL